MIDGRVLWARKYIFVKSINNQKKNIKLQTR
jgi:hypothetical protein